MKILIICLSSIGEIVLTTPVIRCMKKSLDNTELHFLTAPAYKDVLKYHPSIHTVHVWPEYYEEVLTALQNEAFDYVIDLQHDTITNFIKRQLKVGAYSLNRLLLEKFVFTHFKWNVMPDKHLVDRYFETVAPLGVKHDGGGLDFYIPEQEEVSLKDIPASHHAGYIVFIISASCYTKKMPFQKWQELCARVAHPIILVGNSASFSEGEQIKKADAVKVYNACGKFTLHESADLIRKSRLVVSHDTGMMQIAAAFNKPLIVIWGSTTPSLGKTPYFGVQQHKPATLPLYDNVQVHKLWCRPCTDRGREACPQGHFKCMKNIPVDTIAEKINKNLQKSLKPF